MQRLTASLASFRAAIKEGCDGIESGESLSSHSYTGWDGAEMQMFTLLLTEWCSCSTTLHWIERPLETG
jgi:hypothetical protein